MKIGVIGLGVVGYPLFKAFQYYHKEVYGYDIKKTSDTWESILNTDIVFICVPTDKGKDGRLDNSIVNDILNSLNRDKYKGLAVIKSTLGLGYIKDAMKKFKLNIVVFPEWLRSNTAFQDTVNPEMIVIGTTDLEHLRLVREACVWHKYSKMNMVKPEEAVMIKLTSNALATTKISFANQIKLICEKYDIDVDSVMDIVKEDSRCNPRYLDPGWAYGGYCLPKDTSELMTSIDDNFLLEGVEKINKVFLDRGDIDVDVEYY